MASSRQSRLRARSEVSREGAKPRSSDERRTILATPFRNVLRGRAPVGRAQAQADACGGAGGHERDEGCASHGRKGKRLAAEPPRAKAAAQPVPEEPVVAAES